MNAIGGHATGCRMWHAGLHQAYLSFRLARCRGLVLPASRFSHILENLGSTSSIYDGDPLAKISGQRRGTLLQRLARNVCAELSPNSVIQDPLPGICVNGTRRSQHQAEFDWMCDGQRVECKSARLCWSSHEQAWQVQFTRIKMPCQGIREFALFDDLILVLYSPFKLHIIRHDLSVGMSSRGLETSVSGHSVVIRGKKNVECWQEAVATILKKMCTGRGRCEQIATLRTDDGPVARLTSALLKSSIFQDRAYLHVPLAHMCSALRGIRLQSLACEVDKLLNPGSTFAVPAQISTHAEQRSGCYQASCDWVRDQKRIEFKHGKLLWHQQRRQWYCVFTGIKFGCFDELWLGIYCPTGIYIFKHNGSFCVQADGLKTRVVGKQLKLRAAVRESEVPEALDRICSKLEQAGCQRLATVLW
ncbi:unnamed protein product [Polarella glacialis]|uniref:Uncharacterized protein n=1 Tax=Polarella glacialis TaxID=89957 RepID=A0A813DU93_POLGL|nr:unnamed protein product [Polarella glacialis]